MGTRFEPAAAPFNEHERLCALDRYFILDTPSEPAFDELTALGAYTFHVPLCFITLIGEHVQFFKSAFGADMREASRDESFCSHALLLDEPLVILDTLKDDRFALSPHVQSGPRIRFYAGASLMDQSGYKLGTFCLYDLVPRREFCLEEIEALKRFASVTSRLIEQRLLPIRTARAEEEALEAARRVRQILESTSDSVMLLNSDWELTFLNENAVRDIAGGRSLIGQDVWTAFPGSINTLFETSYRKAKAEKKMVSFESYYADLGLYFDVHVHPSGDGLAIFFRNITEKRGQEKILSKLEERYRLATLSASEGIWDWDRITQEAYFSPRWQQIFGLPTVEFIGPISHWLDKMFPRDRQRAAEDFQELSTSDRSEFNYEYRVRHTDEMWRWIRSRGRVVRDENGSLIRMAGSISDITEQKSTDPLTGIHNRDSLLEHIEDGLWASFKANALSAVFIVDLDFFTRINDSFGRDYGDAVLIEVGRRLQSTLVEDYKGIVARISGDEFAIFLRGIPEAEDFFIYARSIQMALSKPIFCNAPRPLSVSASIGIAIAGEDDQIPEKLLEDAYVAAHEARQEGHGRVVVFGAHMREHVRKRAALEADLRGALEGHQLLLHYQPKVLLQSGEIYGFEALVRWIHPERGMVSPAEFIPQAEESGLIVGIGDWTLQQAIHQLIVWRNAGPSSGDLTISVNLSPKQFDDATLVQKIRTVLEKEDAPSSSLSLEITESALIGNMVRAQERLTELARAGIRLELDDFGTGYSSLSYLHQLPFDVLKIDQSFVRKLRDSQESRAIVKSIIQLGESLNLEVIAEGIETIEQRDHLIELGCIRGQGYFYSRPLPVKEIDRLLQEANCAGTKLLLSS